MSGLMVVSKGKRLSLFGRGLRVSLDDGCGVSEMGWNNSWSGKVLISKSTSCYVLR
jgi:hypothetical protein